MLMFNENGGFHNFKDHEVETAKSEGWVDGEEVRVKLIAAKTKPATIDSQLPKRAGRPRKEMPSFLSGVTTDGDSTDDN